MFRLKMLAAAFASSAAALGLFGVATSSAATLYTNSSHTTPVAVGTTATATSGTVTLYDGSIAINQCSGSTLGLTLKTNSGGTVSANITSASFTGCLYSVTAGGFPWVLTVSGSGSASGSNTVWTAASVNDVSVTFPILGTYSGNLTTGVSASQPTATGAPLSLILSSAGNLSGPLTSTAKVTGTWTLTGAAASYSLG